VRVHREVSLAADVADIKRRLADEGELVEGVSRDDAA